MQRIKRMLIAMVAVLAIGAVGATAAQAGQGSITLKSSNYPDAVCDFTFSEGSWSSTTPPASKSISNIQPGANCTVSSISGSGTVTKSNATDASFNGTITVTTTVPVFGLITCTYNPVDLGGTWALSGTDNVFTLGSAWSASWDSSTNWLCPGGYTGGSITDITGTVTTSA